LGISERREDGEKSNQNQRGQSSTLFLTILCLDKGVHLNISNWTPLGASVGAMQDAMQGSFPSLQSILVLTAYTLVLGYLAVRWFKWE
jgi:hypothetical protein